MAKNWTGDMIVINGKELSVAALIMARGGSKRLPEKNIKIFAGKPLLAWTIQYCKESQFIDRTIMSTDCEAIADISREYGAEVPFMRPDALAGDDAHVAKVFDHALDFLLLSGEKPDLIVWMSPTNPLRDTHEIDRFLRYFAAHQSAKILISMVEVRDHPMHSDMLPPDLNMSAFSPFVDTNTQLLPKFYKSSEALKMVDVDYYLQHRRFVTPNTFGYVHEEPYCVDIDSEHDFAYAESLLLNSHPEC